MKPLILEEADLRNVNAAQTAVGAVRAAVEAHGRGLLVAPPRHQVDFDTGALVFTVGGTAEVAGFRVYDTFPDSPEQQLVAVWDARTGVLEGIAVGDMVGALRTGALGALAVDLMSNPDCKTCGVLGSGRQALTQLLCASTVRAFDEAIVYSPNRGRREQFASDATELIGLPVRAVDTPEAAVRDVDVLICATSALQPAFDSEWLGLGTHVNTVGPKYKGAHELPIEVAEAATLIATDSPQQIAAQGDSHFLAGHESHDRVVDLADLIGETRSPRFVDATTVFLSAGLAGTETLVAHELLREARQGTDGDEEKT